jgi:hypothetical protein
MGEILAFFPKPYKDEDFRSLIYRYHIRSGNKNSRQSKVDLFNVSSHKNVYFPCNFNYFKSKLPNESQIKLERLLNDNTFFPLFEPFITSNKYNVLLKSIRQDKGNKKLNLGNLFGMKQDRIISDKLRYCSQCIYEDDKKYGEVYTRRMHQIDFFNNCYIHGSPLISQCPQCKEALSISNQTKLISTPYCFNGHRILDNTISIKKMNKNIMIKQEILDQFYKLLNSESKIYRETFLVKVTKHLGEKGYKDNNGKLKRINLLQDLFQKYSFAELKDVGLTQEYIKSPDVFVHLFSKEKVPDIRLYIILIVFLEIDIEELTTKPLDIEHFQSSLLKKELEESFQQTAATRESEGSAHSLKKSKINWNNYDKELCLRVEAAFSNLYKLNSSKPIKKWSVISILSSTDQSRIRRNLEKLPLTKEVFKKQVETIKDFQVRKLPFVIKKQEDKGLRNITFKSICYELPLYQNCSKEVREYIIKELHKRGYKS